MTIGNSDDINYDLYYFTITDNNNSHAYCNVDIKGEYDSGEKKRLASFFKRSNTTFGLIEILSNELYLEKMKLKVDFTQKLSHNRWSMPVSIYMNKTFLLSLYEYDKLPLFLFKIVRENGMRFVKHINNYNDIKNAENFYNLYQTKIYKRELYNYQKDNVKWMIQLENNINNKEIIKTYNLPTDYIVYNVASINEKIISDKHGQIMNLDNDSLDIEIKGGVLCDEIGLGKTFSILSLIVEQLDKNEEKTSLIFCPTRLCKQVEEIEKTYDLKYKLISTIRQFKKLTINDYSNYDIIILSYNFLSNDNYNKYCLENENNPVLLHNYKWNRIILDEGHEILNSSNKKALLIAKEQLNKIKSNYRWICSGTPYGTLADFKNIINYITNLEYSTLQRHNYNMFLDKLFRKNTKESVKQEVNIPQPIVSTEFLNMSQLERLIYDSALNNPNKQIELCNHIMVSEEHLNILGNKPLSLEEIKEKMTDYYNNKIETYKKRIEKITLIETLENQDNPNSDKIIDEKTKLDDYKLKLQDYTSKYNIFTNIEEKISDDDTCPICLEELKDLNSSITPYGHIFCSSCLNESNNHSHKNKCPMCRYSFKIDEVKTIKPDNNNNDSNNEPKLGTKIHV